MRFYWRSISYFREDAGKIVLSLLLIGVGTLAGLLQPFPLAILVDTVFPRDDPSAHWLHRMFVANAPADRAGQVILLAGAMFGLRILQELLGMCQTLLNVRIGYNGLMRVRCDLFRKLQQLSLAYHKSQPQGDAIYRLSYDTYGFQTILNVLVRTIIVSSATLIIMAAIMFSMNWKLTLAALTIAPAMLLVTTRYAKILRERSTEAKEFDSKLTTSMQRSIASIGLVQAFGREEFEYGRFHNTVRQSVGAWLRLHGQEVIYWLLIGTILGGGAALIFGFGGYLVHRGELTVGMLIVFITYQGKLYDPLNKLSSSAATIQSGVVGARRVFEVLDRDPIIQDPPDARPLPRRPRVLELEHVWFEYRPNEPVLEDVTVTIRPGQMVAFVGSSGVGKTTLLNLLPRFYDPTRGTIRLDGEDLRTVRVADLRRHIALVLQDNVVLPTTVAENIAYGRPEASDPQIRRAAEMSGAADFIGKLPEKYETVISESGANLSSGQRQRIAIARALLTEAPIIVLDEPTSALDPQNEAMINRTLIDLKRQRTIILVSHRLSTVADADQIFVMDGGRIVETGTHAELVARRGLYFRMARHQMKLPDEQAAV